MIFILGTDPLLSDLLSKLLIKDALDRITIEECMRHGWVEPSLDEDKKLPPL